MNLDPQGMDKFAPLTPQERAAIQSARGKMEGEGELVSPIPLDVPDPPQTHRTLGKPSKIWTYRDASGETQFYVCRFDLHGRCKQFLPLSLWRENGGLTWRWKALPDPRPLYGLDWLAKRPDAFARARNRPTRPRGSFRTAFALLRRADRKQQARRIGRH